MVFELLAKHLWQFCFSDPEFCSRNKYVCFPTLTGITHAPQTQGYIKAQKNQPMRFSRGCWVLYLHSLFFGSIYDLLSIVPLKIRKWISSKHLEDKNNKHDLL